MIALQVFCFVVALMIVGPTAMGVGHWVANRVFEWYESRCNPESDNERPTNSP